MVNGQLNRSGRACVRGSQPRQIFVCNVGRVDAALISDPAEADRFWHAARKRIGKLFRLSARDRDAIEALIAEKVPRPAAPSASVWRSYPINGPHQPVVLRTR